MTAQHDTRELGPEAAAPGLARRSLMEVAWTAPVVAAAVAAPGAAASIPSPPSDARTVIGVQIGSYNPLEFNLLTWVTRFETAGPGSLPPNSDVFLAEEGQVDVVSEGDIVAWPDSAILTTSRTARIIIPAGVHPGYNSYVREGHQVNIALGLKPLTMRLAERPTEPVRMRVEVTRGPVDTVSGRIVGSYALLSDIIAVHR